MGKMELELGATVIFGHCLGFDAFDVDDAGEVLVFVGDGEFDLAVVSFVDFAGELDSCFLGGGLSRSLWRFCGNDLDYWRCDISSLVTHQPFVFALISFLLANLVYPRLFLGLLNFFLIHCCDRAYTAHLLHLFPVDFVDEEVVTGESII